MELEDRVSVVTGGGMGIGEAIALELAREGSHVCIFDVDPGAAQRTASKINETGRRSLACEVDITNQDGLDKAVENVLREYGHIDILVNNAGTTHPAQSILDLDPSWFEKIIKVDFEGVYLCSRRIGKEMVKQHSGAVVNIASLAGLVSMPLVFYGPAKSAVIMLTQVLAREWAELGIRVNAIAPIHVLTPLLQRLFDQGLRNRDQIERKIPMKRLIMPSDIANAAVFLCSDKARSITGITLPVDGGFMAGAGWNLFGYE